MSARSSTAKAGRVCWRSKVAVVTACLRPRRVHIDMSFARLTLRTLSRSRPTFAVSKMSAFRLHRANFSAAPGLAKEDIQSRVINVLKGFEKVDPAKLSTSSRFAEDLSLDSLDAVEVVMAIEEEFAIEIPDVEADEIKTVQQGKRSYDSQTILRLILMLQLLTTLPKLQKVSTPCCSTTLYSPSFPAH
ncbi:hypothetical protein F5I97DRAFT_1894670 [Phlebopus sp. FC_14]|nr:hypothetical protein F5I97DRAFT_1894670 [Phlebopus sp. FC_14]